MPLLLTSPHDADALGDSLPDESDFELDLRVVESVIPIAKLLCSTSDGCGSSCCSSACNSSAADPFAF